VLRVSNRNGSRVCIVLEAGGKTRDEARQRLHDKALSWAYQNIENADEIIETAVKMRYLEEVETTVDTVYDYEPRVWEVSLTASVEFEFTVRE
jgi:tRNA G37 N-methylase Trm5